MEYKHSYEELAQYQSLPLDAKIMMTQQRIRAWYDYFKGQVYVSFSGGKDSTVLLDLVRDMYPEVPAVFVDTGLEFPEIKEFVKSKENVTILRPKMSFREVIQQYGYPVIGKEVANTIYCAQKGTKYGAVRMQGKNPDGTYLPYKQKYIKYSYLLDAPFKISDECCEIMKKKPSKLYEKNTGRKPIVATMAEESQVRLKKWMETGCNSFETNRPMSKPMSFWTEQDVLEYIVAKKLPYAPVYGEIVEREGRYQCTGYTRTGCVFCMFGAHREPTPNRFQLLRQTHPKLFEYCMKPWDEGGLGMKEVLDYVGIEYSNGLLDLLEEET